MHHTLATLAAYILAGHLATWQAAANVDPYMWVAIPTVYAQCGRAIRKTLEIG